MEHRLPENHDCVSTPPRTPLGPWKAKIRPVPKPSLSYVMYPTTPKMKAAKKNYRKKFFSILKRIGYTIGGIFLVVILVVYFLGSFPLYLIVIEGIVIPLNANRLDINLVETEIFNQINDRRDRRSLRILEVSIPLNRIAKEWSIFLAENGILEHGNFEARFLSTGLSPYGASGEIIALIPLGSISYLHLIYPGVDEAFLAERFVEGWLSSGPHNFILTNARYTHMGVGVSRNGGSYYGVVDFYQMKGQ